MKGNSAAVLFPLLSIVSIVWTYYLFILAQNIHEFVPKAPVRPRKYTYAYEDFPESLPLELTQPVELLTSETHHYSLTRDTVSNNEWFYTSPHEQGAVRIGPQNRTFFITMFHEMHCLRYFRNILTDRTDADWPHVQHCFNMLRQWTLCTPDLTLESGDFMQRNFETERVGERHVCRDWEAIYDWETGEWAHWYKYLKTHNITGPDLQIQAHKSTVGINGA